MSAPNYKLNDPGGWCGDPRRGAALGRPTVLPKTVSAETVGRLYLRRVRIDGGGYDPNGTYFGHGGPLYWCADADGTVDFMLRAHDREDAKVQVREEIPGARFWR